MKKKRLLFVINGTYPNMNANSEIAYRIARVLREKFSCKITILGGDSHISEASEQEKKEFETIYIPSFINYSFIASNGTKKLSTLFSLIKHPECIRFYLNNKRHDRYARSKEYQYAIDKALRLEKYDCIVCFSGPVDTLRSIPNLKTTTPVIAYKLDPWSTNYYFLKKRETEEIDEHRVDMKAAAIITTDLIRREYPLETPDEILRKIAVLKFPNVIDYGISKNKKQWDDSKCIHCVYTGSIYGDIRNPGYAYKVFDILSHYNIKLHIIGFEYTTKESLKEVPDSIIFHGRVTSDEAMEYMQSSDILVNIGNTVVNMMPSKILTYISLGKPILNFVKNPECPTLPYMTKYPLALNVMETDSLQEADVERMKGFIMKSKGRKIPFEDIKQLYHDCTPEYVGKEVYDIICRVVS